MANILVLGGDGYLGWPTAMKFAIEGHQVTVTDNYFRRRIAEECNSEALIATPSLRRRADLFKEFSGKEINVEICNLDDQVEMERLFEEQRPETVIHYAEQPSAPYSMLGCKEAKITLENNLAVTMNLIWATLKHNPSCHIIKLGTMGEYGTPNIDIEEGWLTINHKGREETVLFPRAASSLYHTTKILDTDLLWFYVRLYGLRVTDLMQGPVYGLDAGVGDVSDALLPNFHYDDIFGTVINRFIVQAVMGMPLTVYGRGNQTRGYLDLRDTINCVLLAERNPPDSGKMNIYNQITQTFSVNELARMLESAGKLCNLPVTIRNISNPRKEKEEHYYNPQYSKLSELGLKPNLLTVDVLTKMLDKVSKYKNRINPEIIMPRVAWNKDV